jgi:hypothetical protein
MTDPQAFVAGQIGQQAGVIRAAQPGQDIPAPVPQAGLGVTGVDVEALAAQIAAMQLRLDQADAERIKAAGNPLADTVKTIQHFLTGHGDPVAAELGEDLAAAVEEAGKSGDTSAVAKIADRLDRHLARNAPSPGENYAYRNLVAFVSDLPDVIDAFEAPPAPGTGVAKVVAGSVVG